MVDPTVGLVKFPPWIRYLDDEFKHAVVRDVFKSCLKFSSENKVVAEEKFSGGCQYFSLIFEKFKIYVLNIDNP